MTDNQNTLKTDEEVYAVLHEKLNAFMLKWPLFFEAVSFNLNEIEKLYENGIYSLRLTDYDETYDRPFRLSFNGMFNHERIHYTISLDTTPKNLSTLTNDKFSPYDMYTDFWLIANELLRPKGRSFLGF